MATIEVEQHDFDPGKVGILQQVQLVQDRAQTVMTDMVDNQRFRDGKAAFDLVFGQDDCIKYHPRRFDTDNVNQALNYLRRLMARQYLDWFMNELKDLVSSVAVLKTGDYRLVSPRVDSIMVDPSWRDQIDSAIRIVWDRNKHPIDKDFNDRNCPNFVQEVMNGMNQGLSEGLGLITQPGKFLPTKNYPPHPIISSSGVTSKVNHETIWLMPTTISYVSVGYNQPAKNTETHVYLVHEPLRGVFS